MRRRRQVALIVLVLGVLAFPAATSADHVVTAATVDARLKERRSTDFWTVTIRWTAGCSGATSPWYGGHLYLVDADTGERIYAGGVVDTSGSSAISGERDWFVSSIDRPRILFPELTISCYEPFPLHGGREAVATGAGVFIPPRFSGGGGPGGANGDYGGGDPTRPTANGACQAALVGTDDPDTLAGTGGGDVVFGLGAGDRIDGRGGHDCLIGGSGNDVLAGAAGSDRLTGGRGADRLVGGPGVNVYDAGPGNDVVEARNGQRELVRCGSGRDRARVDRRDRVSGCEVVLRPRR